MWDKNKTWQELPTPQDIADNQPKIDGDTERNWHYLVREFVKDIKGEKVAPTGIIPSKLVILDIETILFVELAIFSLMEIAIGFGDAEQLPIKLILWLKN